MNHYRDAMQRRLEPLPLWFIGTFWCMMLVSCSLTIIGAVTVIKWFIFGV